MTHFLSQHLKINYFHRNLPAKKLTEGRRRQGRESAKEKAKEFMRLGQTDEAKKEFTKAVDITHDHAVELMRECRKVGVDCITAMYEADSQLAYLNKIGLAEFVISEDSDLILFGCKKIIFKLQLDGRCLLFDSAKLYQTINTTEEKFSFEKFRQICILSGCDYLDSLPGIGLQKAKKFLMLTEETDMKRALLKIPSYLGMKNLEVTDEYIEAFLRAEATFKHMFVYNPVKREMLRLNPIDDSDPMIIECCSNAGKLLEPSVAYQLALGNINPRTFNVVDNFDPDTVPTKDKFRKHPSIWQTGNFFKTAPTNGLNKQQSNISSFFNPTQKQKQLVEVQNIIEQENHVTSEVELDDLVSSYCVKEAVTSKRRNADLKSEEENRFVEVKEETPKRNPFAKRHQLDTKKSAEKPSLLESLNSKTIMTTVEKHSVEQSSPRVVSRFFAHKKTNNESNDEINEEVSDENDPDICKFNILRQERQLQHDMFYEVINNLKRVAEIADAAKGNSDSLLDSQGSQRYSNGSEETSSPSSKSEDTEDIVDLERYQFKTKSQKQTYINEIKPKPMLKPTKGKFRGPGLTKTKTSSSPKSDDLSVQTKLSKFGFQKKSTLT